MLGERERLGARVRARGVPAVVAGGPMLECVLPGALIVILPPERTAATYSNGGDAKAERSTIIVSQ